MRKINGNEELCKLERAAVCFTGEKKGLGEEFANWEICGPSPGRPKIGLGAEKLAERGGKGRGGVFWGGMESLEIGKGEEGGGAS